MIPKQGIGWLVLVVVRQAGQESVSSLKQIWYCNAIKKKNVIMAWISKHALILFNKSKF